MQTRQIRMAAVAAVVTACAVVAYVAWGDLEKNLVYYLAADELLAKGPAAHGATVRLGGLVQQGSMHWDPNTLELSFTLGLAASGTPNIAVQATGAPPQMFQEGTGAVVEGQFDGRLFHADRVMVKHSNEYRPPAAGERPSEIYQLPKS